MVEDFYDFLEGPQTSLYTPTIPNLISDINMDLLFDQEKLDAINADTATSKVFLIGMPSDIGVRALDGRHGAERGPESFREMVTLCAMPSNPVCHDVSLLERVKLYDCGNMPVNQGQASEHKDMTREESGAKLANLTAQILSKVHRSKVMVIGGSDEMNLNLMQALD